MKKLLLLLFCLLIPINCLALDIYNYDKAGYFVSKTVARISPLDKKDMIPAQATIIKPIEYDKVNEEIKFEKGGWVVVENREKARIAAEELQAERDRCMTYFNEDGICLYKKIGEFVIPRTEEEIAVALREKKIQAEIAKIKEAKEAEIRAEAEAKIDK